jgi:hypothetical protein
MRTAKDGLSKHATKGFRISIGRKPDGGYRTFWLGQNRIVAEESARLYREHFAMMQLKDGRDVWTANDEEWVRGFVDQFKLGLMKLQQRQPIHIQNAEQKVREAEQKVEEAKQNAEREKAIGHLQAQAFGIEPVTTTLSLRS